jgi:hypothetical protein
VDALAFRDGKAVLIDVGDFPINLSVTGTIGHDGVWRGEVVTAENTILDLKSIGAVYYCTALLLVSHCQTIAAQPTGASLRRRHIAAWADCWLRCRRVGSRTQLG